MYGGCSGAAYVYTCCIVERCVLVKKYLFLALDFTNRNDKSAWGNGKRPYVQD
jgi:hypothetical protein